MKPMAELANNNSTGNDASGYQVDWPETDHPYSCHVAFCIVLQKSGMTAFFPGSPLLFHAHTTMSKQVITFIRAHLSRKHERTYEAILFLHIQKRVFLRQSTLIKVRHTRLVNFRTICCNI